MTSATMRIAVRLMLVAAALGCILGRGEASANYTFTVGPGGGFGDGTALTGSFTTNDALTSLVAFDFKTSQPNGVPFEYTPSSVVGATLTSTSLLLTGPQPFPGPDYYQLSLNFASGLSKTAATSISGIEYYPGSGHALNPATYLVPQASVPEPSSLALCGVAGAIGLGVARARRRAVS